MSISCRRSRPLIETADNWLHISTVPTQITYYGEDDNLFDLSNIISKQYGLDPPIIGPPNVFIFDSDCRQTLASDDSSAPLPCSLNMTNGVTNLKKPDFVYQTLEQGISQINSSFNTVNFTSLDDSEDKGSNTDYQIVTTFQNGTLHSIFFNPNSAESIIPEIDVDFIANTPSMTTQCAMATKECNITSGFNQNENNLSIPFHCYDGFSGDLGKTPANGHEKAQGWNMSFYETSDGLPVATLTQFQSNPFSFYVAAAIDSIDYWAVDNGSFPNIDDGSLVDVGGGLRAFALSCEATIYDVSYSFVNGSFHSFNTSKASPQKASIIKAPLQVGFGQYHLYEFAKTAVVLSGTSLNDTMSTAFSQTAMALASGVFDYNYTTRARYRWTGPATRVLKIPFWFLVITCLLYAVVGFLMTIVAFILKRTPQIREHQAYLMRQWAPEIQAQTEMEEETGQRLQEATTFINSANSS